MNALELSRRGMIVAALIGVTGLATAPAFAQTSEEIAINFADMPVGAPPPGFTPGLTAGGGPVAWNIIDDASAPGGRADRDGGRRGVAARCDQVETPPIVTPAQAGVQRL